MTLLRFYPTTEAGQRTPTWTPATDIIEKADGYTITLDAPGFTREGLTIKVREGVLTVSGERKSPEGEDEKYFHYHERPYGTFERSFRLPEHIDSESIKASYENGVLTLELNKKEEAKPHLITIK